MQDLVEKLRMIRMVVFDVDGVMTNGQIWLDSNNEWKRAWSVQDGSGIRQLMELGYTIGVITAATAADVTFRMKWLGVEHFYNGAKEKLTPFQEILKKTGFEKHEIAYMGDDVYDVPIMNQVGFGATVPGAVEAALEAAHYVTKHTGGNGAVREVCDLIKKYGKLAQQKGLS